MIAGAKQSNNPWLPEIRTFTNGGVDELIAHSSVAEHRILPWEQQDNLPILTADLVGQPGLTIYVIGPEGGFSQREITALRKADFTAVSLGTRVLRCETAATLCLGIHWWSSHMPDKAKGTMAGLAL